MFFVAESTEAKELSKKFNERGWRTQALSGSDSESARADAIERLAADAGENILDYIISVDIFSRRCGCAGNQSGYHVASYGVTDCVYPAIGSGTA